MAIKRIYEKAAMAEANALSLSPALNATVGASAAVVLVSKADENAAASVRSVVSSLTTVSVPPEAAICDSLSTKNAKVPGMISVRPLVESVMFPLSWGERASEARIDAVALLNAASTIWIRVVTFVVSVVSVPKPSTASSRSSMFWFRVKIVASMVKASRLESGAPTTRAARITATNVRYFGVFSRQRVANCCFRRNRHCR